MKNIIYWKNLLFVPENADKSQGICLGQKGFLELCRIHRDGYGPAGYSVHDLGMKPGEGGRSVHLDWRGFSKAYQKQKPEQVNQSVSMFRGEWPLTAQAQITRRRILEAVFREYEGAETLAMDIVGWLISGRRRDIAELAHYLHHISAACASKKRSDNSDNSQI